MCSPPRPQHPAHKSTVNMQIARLQPMYADFLDPGTCLHRLVVSFWAPACPKHRKFSGCNRRTRILLTPGPAYGGGLDTGTCLQGWAGPRDLLCHVLLYHVFVVCLVGCHLICRVASVSNAWWLAWACGRAAVNQSLLWCWFLQQLLPTNYSTPMYRPSLSTT